MSRRPTDELGSTQKTGHGSKFGRKKEAAIAALLTQRNVEEAARAAGIGTRTLIRWLQIPEFQSAYREARRAAVSQSSARLQQASSAAVSTLLKIMVDADAPAGARVRAADRVLDHSKQAIENEDIEVRVAALEQAAKLAKPPKGGLNAPDAECARAPKQMSDENLREAAC